MKVRGQIIYAILMCLSVAGTIAVSIVAPNLLQIFSRFSEFPKSRNDNIRRSIWLMKSKGLIKYTTTGIKITKAGLKFLEMEQVNHLKLSFDNPSDGKQRIVIFDIPVKRKKIRAIFLSKLKEFAFKYLQKSVWSLDVPCEKEIDLLRSVLKLKKCVSIIIADKII